MPHHLRNGFYFEREKNGSVTIYVTGIVNGPAPILRKVTVPGNEWASVVAHVSKRGETGKTFEEAFVLHNKI